MMNDRDSSLKALDLLDWFTEREIDMVDAVVIMSKALVCAIHEHAGCDARYEEQGKQAVAEMILKSGFIHEDDGIDEV